MNWQLLAGGIVGALAVTALGAVGGYRMRDQSNYAEVVAVVPAMNTVSVPREECRDETVTLASPTLDPDQLAGTLVGGVVGGVLGNQVGSGGGKKLATIGGAVAGGYAGNKIQEGMQRRDTHQEIHRTCRTVRDSHQEQHGYDVTYRLNGSEQRVHMNYHPGQRIPIENGQIVVRQ